MAFSVNSQGVLITNQIFTPSGSLDPVTFLLGHFLLAPNAIETSAKAALRLDPPVLRARVADRTRTVGRRG